MNNAGTTNATNKEILEFSEESLLQCPFVNQKYRMGWPGIKPQVSTVRGGALSMARCVYIIPQS
jgi:hypothetical protein